MKKLVIVLIRFYQKFISPLVKIVSPLSVCRFSPSCSDYFIESVDKFGLISGGIIGLKRLARCQPFSPGGYDPIS